MPDRGAQPNAERRIANFQTELTATERAIKKNDYRQASEHINRALRLDPINRRAHLINAFVYHVLWLQGSTSARDLARAGYDVVLKKDPANWHAAYLLGLLYLQGQEYVLAQQALAQALLYERDYPDLLRAFAQASYAARDPVAATVALQHLYKTDSSSIDVLRGLCLSYAALGQFEHAKHYEDQLIALHAPEPELRFVQDRMDDWQIIHAQYISSNSLVMAASALSTTGMQSSSGGAEALLQAAQASENQAQQAIQSYQPPASATSANGGIPRPGPGQSEPLVGMFEVTLIQTEETSVISKGVNLLDGLSMMLGSSPLDLDGYQYTSTHQSGQPVSRTITRTITIPQLNYSLNIANAEEQTSDVLARPTLVAMDGQESTFSSGDTLSIPLPGQYGGTLSDQDVGISISVTPTFLSATRMLLRVNVKRSFFEPVYEGITVQEAFQTSTVESTINVAIDINQTLIVSGLNERQVTNTNSGVPGLRKIPIVRYAFGVSERQSANKSVLILITPRNLVSNVQLANPEPLDGESDAVSLLKQRWKEWATINPGPTWQAVLYHLRNNVLLNEFRQGDLSRETEDAVGHRKSPFSELKALEFFFF